MSYEKGKEVYIPRVGKDIFRGKRERVTFRKEANQRSLFPLLRGWPRKKKLLETFLSLYMISWGYPESRRGVEKTVWSKQ